MKLRDGIECDDARLADICRRYHVRELALFGSVLRDDFRADSDVDVLVDFEPHAPIGLFEQDRLHHELAALLGRDTDLVSRNGMRPRFAKRVLTQMHVIYGSPAGYCPRYAPSVRSEQQRAEDCLLDIVEFAGEIEDMLAGVDRETFIASDLMGSAVTLKLVWIGESVTRIPGDYQHRYPHVAWDRSIEFRDLSTQRYYELDGTRIWDAATVDAPKLRDIALRMLAAEFPDDAEGGA
jgi:uncharacterized protein with HEPN domain/predicted nucleotidyltransferase